MVKNKKELFSRLYIVKTLQEVYEFDWKFVLPVMEELDKLKRKYFLFYSHYVDNRPNRLANFYLRFRIYGDIKIIEHFNVIESNLINLLTYGIDKDEISIEILMKKHNINKKEVIKLFEFWDKASRFKIELIKSFQNGIGTHYALNTLGFIGIVYFQIIVDSKTINTAYHEEQEFVDRNFPVPVNINK